MHKPEFSNEATLEAFDAVIREVRENGISADELEQLKVKWRSDYFALSKAAAADTCRNRIDAPAGLFHAFR